MTSFTSLSTGRRRILYALLLSSHLLLSLTSRAAVAASIIPRSAQTQLSPTPDPPPRDIGSPTPQAPTEFPPPDLDLPQCPAEASLLVAGTPPLAKREHLQAILPVVGSVRFQCYSGRYVELEPTVSGGLDGGMKLYNYGDALQRRKATLVVNQDVLARALQLDGKELGREIGLYRYGVPPNAPPQKQGPNAPVPPPSSTAAPASIRHYFYLERKGYRPYGRSRDSERVPGHPHPMRWDRLFMGTEKRAVKKPPGLLLGNNAVIQPESVQVGNPNDKVRAYRVLQSYGENVAGKPCRTWGFVVPQYTIDVPYRAVFLLYGPQRGGLLSALKQDRIEPICRPDTVTTERGQKRPG